MIDIIDLIFLVIILILTIQILTLLKNMKEEEEEIILFGSDLFFNRINYPDHRKECIRRFKYLLIPVFNQIFKGRLNYFVPLAICAWETGYLSDPEATNFVVNHNNIFGITKRTGGAFHFDSVNSCVSYFLWLMQQPLYEKAWENRFDGEKFIKSLWPTYNPNTSWRDGVLDCYRVITSRWNEV